jgi:pimeloyl-ACP methyl ester carboxylesterase
MSDIVSEETSREFLEAVPHAEYVDVKDASHMVAGDQNDVFSEAVVRFLTHVIDDQSRSQSREAS